MSFQKRLNFGSAQETEIDAVRFEPLANGVRYTFVFGGMAKGVRRSAFGVWRLAFGVRCSAFGVRRSCSSSNPAARSDDGVLECGSIAPALHPATAGLKMLKGRQINCSRSQFASRCVRIPLFRRFSTPNPLRGCNSDLARYSTTPSLRAAGFEDEDVLVRLVSIFNPLRGCNSGKALLIGLTRLFCKQQRSSTSTSTNAERQTPNAKREAPGEGGPFLATVPKSKLIQGLITGGEHYHRRVWWPGFSVSISERPVRRLIDLSAASPENEKNYRKQNRSCVFQP